MDHQMSPQGSFDHQDQGSKEEVYLKELADVLVVQIWEEMLQDFWKIAQDCLKIVQDFSKVVQVLRQTVQDFKIAQDLTLQGYQIAQISQLFQM